MVKVSVFGAEFGGSDRPRHTVEGEGKPDFILGERVDLGVGRKLGGSGEPLHFSDIDMGSVHRNKTQGARKLVIAGGDLAAFKAAG